MQTKDQNKNGIIHEKSGKVVKEMLAVRHRSSHPAILMSWMGFKSASVTTRHDERHAGVSNYSYWKVVKLTLQMVMCFSPVLLRGISLCGLITSGVSFVIGIYFLFRKLFFHEMLPGFTSIVVLITFFFGITFVFLGVISEYIAKIFQDTLGRPDYIVDWVQGGEKTNVPAFHGPVHENVSLLRKNKTFPLER